ncbi:MAG TPA: F0F1 ATP synthase subunit gamma [Candidatus Saccharimonadales bacterium]|jgi:ATP synthase F1 gamma subunit|nr:F0F1 ATP synthase subunit gamma [Candidatus Saccharimonadales bacterium]
MIRPQDIARERDAMRTIMNLTSVFEGLASMRIAQTKNQVLQSQQFFKELWAIYTQIRVDNLFRFGRSKSEEAIPKQLYIAVTSEGGFSGDIDQKLMSWMIGKYDAAKNDIIIIGHHGAVLLTQSGITYNKYFSLPTKDQNINVQPLIQEVKKYRGTTVFYQTYTSLMIQDIKQIELSTAVQEQGAHIKASPDLISDRNYIFEPDTFAVIAHLERSMLQISLSQVILDSKLAQYASRFRAMTTANERADDLYSDLRLRFNRAKRATNDERLKEMINGLKKAGSL